MCTMPDWKCGIVTDAAADAGDGGIQANLDRMKWQQTIINIHRLQMHQTLQLQCQQPRWPPQQRMHKCSILHRFEGWMCKCAAGETNQTMARTKRASTAPAAAAAAAAASATSPLAPTSASTAVAPTPSASRAAPAAAFYAICPAVTAVGMATERPIHMEQQGTLKTTTINLPMICDAI